MSMTTKSLSSVLSASSRYAGLNAVRITASPSPRNSARQLRFGTPDARRLCGEHQLLRAEIQPNHAAFFVGGERDLGQGLKQLCTIEANLEWLRGTMSR